MNSDNFLMVMENHYQENYEKLVKKMGFRAGNQWAGEDIVQTAYERALRYQQSCQLDRFGQWFSMLLNNAFIDYVNSERGYSQIEIEFEEAETTDCPHYPEHIVREIHALIDTKSVVQVEVLTLHFKHGYSAIDVSHLTSYTYAQCHKIIQRFRDELKELYND